MPGPQRQPPDQPTIADVTGVLLAGGRSTRMGQDKATLRVGGRMLAGRVLDALREVFATTLVAGDRPDLATPETPCVADRYPGSALGGIHGALAAAATPWVFVAPCDLAHPDPRLMRHLAQRREGFDVVVPRTDGGLEPVFALYHKNCLPHIERLLSQGSFRVYDFYDHVRTLHVEARDLPDGWRRALLNLNDPRDVRRVAEEEP